MVIRAFITHKQAELFADCQDRFGVNPDTKSIAVSDGMGATWQQKIWAQLLVDTYISSPDWHPSKESIQHLCQAWRVKVTEFIQNLKDINAPINIIYRSERCLAEGRSAGATFVGIRFDENKWHGEVLGDSCLIEWDGNEAKFNTSQDTDAFDSYPDYFDSDSSKEGKGIPKPIAGTIKDGTILFLVSDPFSEFLLEHSKQGDIAKYIQSLLSLTSHDDFEALVDVWRKEGMHNDDTTLVIVESDNSDALTIIHKDDIVKMVEEEKTLNGSKAEMVEAKSSEYKKNSAAIEQTTDKQEEDANRVKASNNSLDAVNANTIIEEFLTEYKSVLGGKCKRKSQKAIKRFWSELQYKTTQNAAKEALHTILNKYVIYAK